MVRLFTATRMRLADRLAAEAGVPGLVLMENAGRAVAEVTAGLATTGGRIVILAGKGNNGGDGLVAARHLAARGFAVEVVLSGKPGDFTGDAEANLVALRDAGFERWQQFDAARPEDLAALLDQASLVVDALLGTGARGAPREPAATMIRLLSGSRLASGGPAENAGPASPRRRQPSVLAVDIPSGLDADTGQAADPCVRADATVTLGGIKLGLALPGAALYRGRLYLAPIGLPQDCLERALASGAGDGAADEPPLAVDWLLPREAAAYLPGRPVEGHKGTFGHVRVVAGSPGFTGAAVLAGLGALRGGAGLATVACPEGCRPVVAASLPELLTKGLPESPDGRVAGEAVIDATGGLDLGEPSSGSGYPRSGGSGALVLGPGLGATPETAVFVSGLLRKVLRRIPLVIDADGLNGLALGGPAVVGRALAGAAGDRPTAHGDSVAPSAAVPALAGLPPILTPHPGEMARLTGKSVADIQADRLGTAVAAARSWQAVVVLKGAGTVIAAPDGRVWINATGNPGMATGGSGDVLAGLIGAFLAQGLEPVEAALLGVSAHGLAGDLAAHDLGSRGLLASDIAGRLPRALRALEGLGEAGPGSDPGPGDSSAAPDFEPTIAREPVFVKP